MGGSSSSQEGGPQKKPRPPALVLKKEAWPPLSLAAELRHAAIALAERPCTELRILTWNVWFDPFYGPQRQQALVKELLGAAPDIACLQEVLPVFAEVLRQNTALCEVYDISTQDVEPYGCLMLVWKDLQPRFGSQEVPSNMDRSLLFAECTARCPGLLIATAHLESLNCAAVRKQQLQIAADLLKRYPMSVMCGDFNFDDTQTWGDWRREKPQCGPEGLENNVLQDVLPSFCDTWRFVHPSEPGKTFDGEANPVCVPDQLERMRYDRVLASIDGGLKPTAAELLGTKDIEGQVEGLKPSDHFGVLVDFDLKASSC